MILNYYGFEDVDSIPITVTIPQKEIFQQAIKILATYEMKIKQKEHELELEMKDKKRESEIMKFARDCCIKVMEGRSTIIKVQLPNCWETTINEHLNMFGLSWNGRSRSIIFSSGSNGSAMIA